MSDDFDDLPSGSGEGPTKDQILKVYHYLRAHKRPHKTKNVLDEVIALGFVTSRATVGRALEGAEGRDPPPRNAAEKRTERRRMNDRHAHKPRTTKKGEKKPTVAEAAAKIDPETLGEITNRMLDLLAVEDGRPKHSSAELAIEENRVAMVLNITIAEAMTQKAPLLLLDMRGAAALVDAITVARKLSGGAAIDITTSAANLPVVTNGNGHHPMKEINPPVNGFAEKLRKFRQERDAADRVSRN